MGASLMPARRGVLGGAALIAIGVPLLLQALGVADGRAYLFLALGLAFGAAWWLGTRAYVSLFPAAALITFGVGLLLPTWFSLPAELAAPIFLFAVAIGFAVVVLVDPSRRVPLIPAALLAIVAVLVLLGMGSVFPDWLQRMFVPLLFIALGVYLLVEPRTH